MRLVKTQKFREKSSKFLRYAKLAKICISEVFLEPFKTVYL